MKSICVLFPIGRGGSYLTHAILASRGDVRTPQAIIDLVLPDIEPPESWSDWIYSMSEEFCRNSVGTSQSLWYSEGIEPERHSNDSYPCSCSADGPLLIHLHHFLRTRKKEQRVALMRFVSSFHNKNLKLLLVTKPSWNQNVASWSRVPQRRRLSSDLCQVLVACLELRGEYLLFQEVSKIFESETVTPEDWHLRPNQTISRVERFLGLDPMPFQREILLEGHVWNGGLSAGTLAVGSSNISKHVLETKKSLLLMWLYEPQPARLKRTRNLLRFCFLLFLPIVVIIDGAHFIRSGLPTGKSIRSWTSDWSHCSLRFLQSMLATKTTRGIRRLRVSKNGL